MENKTNGTPANAPTVALKPTTNNADPLNSGIPQQSAADVIDTTIPAGEEYGGTGTYIFSGFLTKADYNPDFTGMNRIKIYDEMRLSEPKIRLGLGAVKYPILAARWYIKPGAKGKEDDPRVQLLREELFKNPNFSFYQFLREALLFCDYGNMFFEKVYRQRRDGKVGWLKFAPRLSSTIYRYTMSDGKTPGITQILPTTGSAEIPMWKLLMLVLDREGANYEGHSLLRYAYKPYFYKNLYQKIDSIAAERQGCGFPVLYTPPSATDADKAKAREIAQNIRVNQNAYAELPMGFKIEWQDMKTNSLKSVTEQIKEFNRDMLDGFMAGFLDLGSKSTGTRDLSQDQSEFFYLSEEYICQTFREPLNLAARELLDLNMTTDDPELYPTIEYAGIGKSDILQLGSFLKDSVQSGIIIPDDNTEQYVRAEAGLPPADRIENGETIDPEERRIPQPGAALELEKAKAEAMGKMGNKPVDKKQHMVNKEFSEAMEFMEDVIELEKRVADAIDRKKPVTL